VFTSADTIVAIATPPGRGGIGVVRLSGPAARAIADCCITHAGPLEPRQATLTFVRARLDGRDGPGADELHENRDAAPAPARTQQTGSDATAAIDQVVATFFPAPASYTGEDVVELSAHGSPIVLRAIVEGAMQAGARLAEPGEFTLRAFLNGRMNLVQAEAVRDLVEAVTPLQARAAFDQLQGTLTEKIQEIDSALFDLAARLEASIDFPEEGYQFADRALVVSTLDQLVGRATQLIASGRVGRLVREGAQVAIVGKPNVGKSSLFNALVGASRAIVTEVAGTTRDLVTEVVDMEGVRITFIDTAGLRESGDPVEVEGIRRTRHAESVADVILVVLDGSAPLEAADEAVLSENASARSVIVKNKADAGSAWTNARAVTVSAVTGSGIAEIRRAILRVLAVAPEQDRPDITNVRHIALVQRACESMKRALGAVRDSALPEEFVLADLQEARAALEEIAGRRTSEDVLVHIFSQFCIGK
jgi:tRNA modification GTPase